MLLRKGMEKQIKDFSLYIIGTTATGKTKLSLSMGKNFNGQIVSADSMQMYRKADILTAKATKEEQSIAKHHMIDIFDLNVTNFNRNDYYHLAKKAFDQIHAEHSFPIVIGGTNYYIETLLFKQKISENRINLDDPNAFILEMQKKNLLLNLNDNQEMSSLQKEKIQIDENDYNEEEDYENEDEISQDQENKKRKNKANQSTREEEIKQMVEKMEKDERYKKLKELDSLLANKLHPNDDRRIFAYLCQALTTSLPPSQSMDDHENVPLRNPNCLIFWPRCKSTDKLNQQIRKRIYEMISEDGIYEAFYIFNEIVPKNVVSEEHPVFLKGVLQSIGYKEFFSFYQLCLSKNYPNDLTKEEYISKIKYLMEEDEEGKKVMKECIEKLITHTIQYTKRQLKWIRHRIMINSDSEQIKNRLFVFEFDHFTSEDFKEKAIDPAISILTKYFELVQKANEINNNSNDGVSLFDPIEELGKDEELKKYLINIDELNEIRKGHFKKGLNDWKNYYCDTCKKEIYGELNWSIHNTSKRHKRAVKSIEKTLLREKYFAENNITINKKNIKIENNNENDDGENINNQNEENENNQNNNNQDQIEQEIVNSNQNAQ